MTITLYSLDEAFEQLHVSRSEGLDLIDSPNGPQVTRVDGQMHIAEQHLHRFLTDRQVPAEGPGVSAGEFAAARAEYHTEQAAFYADQARDSS